MMPLSLKLTAVAMQSESSASRGALVVSIARTGFVLSRKPGCDVHGQTAANVVEPVPILFHSIHTILLLVHSSVSGLATLAQKRRTTSNDPMSVVSSVVAFVFIRG